MSRRTETSVEDREIVVKLALEGKSLREIGVIVGRSRSTIQGIVRKFINYGITSNKQGRGRKPILDEVEKRNIALEIIRDPNQSVPKLTSEIASRIGRPVSCETIRRVVRTVGYQGITEVGCSPVAEKQMDEENPSAVDDEQMEGVAEFRNKKIRRRKKQLYQIIRKQMEFYFSDANLTKDRFLAKLISEDPNIDISIFLRFNKIRVLTTDARDIANALRGSDLLSVTEDGTKIFRTTPITQKTNTDDCTVYVEQLPPDAQHDWLREVFSAYGNVSYVSIPKFKMSGKIKGFAFVEFETPEEANKTLEAFGAMGCRLSPQMAPETLCSIQTFEPEEQNPEAIPDEEIKQESTDEDPENPSRKKKKKKTVKLQLSEETNIEESKPNNDSESSEQIKLKKRKKSEENETEESNTEQELAGDDAPPKKKKRKKNESIELVIKDEQNAEEGSSNIQQSDVSEVQPEKKKRKRKSEDTEIKSNDEESESTEIPVGKKKHKKGQERTEEVEENTESVSDQMDKHSEKKKRKRKNGETDEVEETVEENVEQSEGAENEEELEETGEEEAEVGDGKKRRKRKKHKKKKPDVEAGRLKILAKKEWKRLRNKYLDLQKVKMKCLKHYMGRNKWGRSTPARSQQSNGSAAETSTETADKKPRISYTPGVIVHAVLAEPVMDIRKFKADVKTLSDIEYVDIMMGANEAFIRCATSSAAENLISNAPWQQSELLKGDDEKTYWDKIFEDRQEKFSQKVRVKQRGRDKVLTRAERELGKHIRFDD